MLGLHCVVAENGREALLHWREGRHALVLTDLHMPEMDGYELTARIRGEEPPGQRTPIIAVTANALRGEAQRCIDAGMDDFITKPVQVAVLQRVLARWLPAGDDGTPIPQRTRAPLPPEPTGAPALAMFDAQVLPGLIGNDAALIAEFLADFQISAQDTAHAIHTACVAGDWRRVGELAHRLKSSSRSVGAMQLGEICAALEQAGRNQDGDRIPGLAGDLAAALDAAAHRMTEPQTTDSAG